MAPAFIFKIAFAFCITAEGVIHDMGHDNLSHVRNAVEMSEACFGTHEYEFRADLSERPSNTREFDALLDFFNSTGGDLWINRDGWGVGDPCRNFWFGIQCDCEGNVVAIRLPDNRLGGSIPPSIANLTALRLIDLHTSVGSLHNRNILVGTVPALADISSLSALDVSGNRLNSVYSADSISSRIESLCASGNDFGSIPWNLDRLTELRILDLSDSNIEAVFPSSAVCDMSHIYVISFANNTITGNFFDACLLDLNPLIFDMTAFIPSRGFDVQGLTGEVPSALASRWSNIDEGYISFYLQPLIEGHFGAVCVDTRFCFKSNFRAHTDLAWVQLTDIPSYVYDTIEIAQAS